VKKALRFLSFGLALPCAAMAGFWGGQWINARLGVSGLDIGLALAGFGGVVWQMYREMRRYADDE
jgi:hypothetical protein